MFYNTISQLFLFDQQQQQQAAAAFFSFSYPSGGGGRCSFSTNFYYPRHLICSRKSFEVDKWQKEKKTMNHRIVSFLDWLEKRNKVE
ncbi:hypothetical protein T09_13653 [Trichinella sp. T9]|nr:hypothetical protein T09_13653 [Trichinella sp. T9]